MARPLRIELAGGLYHVTARGDRREDIYFGPEDREAWLEIFGRVCERFNWVCHAYCQMTNHYHIVIETPEGNLSKGMRQLNGVYTQYINRTHQRVGHVFQGRYKGILVERDSYLLELSRYVVLNPVRAGMTQSAKQWAWSSHRAMLGAAPRQKWLETDWILGQFGAKRGRAIEKYEEFVKAGVNRPLWDELRNQIFLGDEKFVERMQKMVDAQEGVREIPRAQRRSAGKPLDYYFPKGREGMAQAYLSGDYTMQDIADRFGVHYSTVSRAVREFESDNNA